MSERTLYDFAIQKSAILGFFEKESKFTLEWLPEYIKEFPEAVRGTKLNWQKCKFIPDAKQSVPEKHGVYCFIVLMGNPFPEEIYLPLYIGKAAPSFLSERFEDYLQERKNRKGREKIVTILNMYHNQLWFCWAELPRNLVDTVEEHLLMCLKPYGNTQFPKHEKLWGKAFE